MTSESIPGPEPEDTTEPPETAEPPLAPFQPEVTTDTPEPSTTLPPDPRPDAANTIPADEPQDLPFDGTEESRKKVFEEHAKGQ